MGVHQLDHPDLQEAQDQLDHLETQDHLGHLDPLDQMDHQDHWELQLLHHHHLHHAQQFVLRNVYQLVHQPVVHRRNIKNWNHNNYSVVGTILALSATTSCHGHYEVFPKHSLTASVHRKTIFVQIF